MIRLRSLTRHFVSAGAFFILGCASYQSNISGARTLMEERQFDPAIEKLKKLADESGGDQLAYMLEYATALHQAGRYADSNKVFIAADKLADLNDYTSLSRTAGTYVVSEGLTQFRPETFEYLLINVYEALNFIMLGDFENAQVMSRRIDEKLKKMEVDKESKKKQASFAAYLSAMIWEAQGDWDNAFVLYNKAYEAVPDVEQYQRDVLIAARRSNRPDAYEKLKAKFPQIDKSVNWNQIRQQGEFVFIFQQGWIPRKQPRRENQQLPVMVPVASQTRRATAEVDGTHYESKMVFDLDNVATITLEDDYKRLVAKALARTATRDAVILAAANNQRNTALDVAALGSFILGAVDRADLRQWSTLPAEFQVVRVYLNPGPHKITIKPDMRNPGANAPVLYSGDVKIEKGKTVFMTQRAY